MSRRFEILQDSEWFSIENSNVIQYENFIPFAEKY